MINFKVSLCKLLADNVERWLIALGVRTLQGERKRVVKRSLKGEIENPKFASQMLSSKSSSGDLLEISRFFFDFKKCFKLQEQFEKF